MSKYHKEAVLSESSPAHRVKRFDAFEEAWLSQYNYAIINPLQVAERDWSDLPCIPLKSPSTKVRDRVLPHLVQLNSIDRSSHDQIQKKIRAYVQRGRCFFSALLKCDQPLDDVVTHFRFTLEQPRYGSSRRWWLRFYDPLVFRHMCWLLDSHQMDRLMGPIQNWCWPEGLGPWCNLDRQAKTDTTVRLPLLRKGQWDMIDRFATLNLTIERLSLFAPETVRSIIDYPEIDRFISEAQLKYKLTDKEDLSLYAEQAVRFTPQIHDHPLLKQRLDEVNKQGISYAELCHELSDESMERMAIDMDLEITHD